MLISAPRTLGSPDQERLAAVYSDVNKSVNRTGGCSVYEFPYLSHFPMHLSSQCAFESTQFDFYIRTVIWAQMTF